MYFQGAWASQARSGIPHLASYSGIFPIEFPAEAKHSRESDIIILTISSWCCYQLPSPHLMTIHPAKHWRIKNIYRPRPGVKNSPPQLNPNANLSSCSPSVQSPHEAPINQSQLLSCKVKWRCSYFYTLTRQTGAILPLSLKSENGWIWPSSGAALWRTHTYLIQEAMLHELDASHLSYRTNSWKEKFPPSVKVLG